MYVLTKRPEKAPNKPQYVEIEFKNGNAVAVDGEKMSRPSCWPISTTLGGQHGIGRVDLLENRYVGMKSPRRLRDPRRHHPRARPTAASSRSPWTARSCTSATA